MGYRSGRRNSRRRDSGRNKHENGKDQEKINHPECPFCSKPVRDIGSAIASRENGEPSHFDCVVKRLAEEENLQGNERICYLGNGCFGVIQPKSGSGPINFIIKKRIQYENSEKKYEWRKGISGRISSLTR